MSQEVQSSGEKRKRPKSYYLKCSKKQNRGGQLEIGMSGFFATCNHREKDAVKEAYNLLNEYADQFGKQESASCNEDRSTIDGNVSDDDDVENALNKEIASIKNLGNRQSYKFKQVDTKVKGCLFIRSNVECHPTELVYAILRDIVESGKQKTRCLIRLIPVSMTCRADNDDIASSVSKQIPEYFESLQSAEDEVPVSSGGDRESTTDTVERYTIVLKIRNNNRLKRAEIIQSVIHGVKDKHGSKYQPIVFDDSDERHRSSKLCYVLLNVLQTKCCVSFVKGYNDRCRFNLLELASKAGARIRQTEDLNKQSSQTE